MFTDGQPVIPFVAELDRVLLALRAREAGAWPDLSKGCRTITIFSDYGGESPEATHATYTFLCVPYETLGVFFAEAKAIRERHGLVEPYKEVALKDLHYGPLSRSVKDWLGLIAHFPGLLFTLQVDRRLSSIFVGNDRGSMNEIGAILGELGYDAWKGAVAEKLLRIVHTVAYLAAALSVEGQRLFWMTHEDAIVGNDRAFTGARVLLGRVLDAYAPGRFERVLVSKGLRDVHRVATYDDLVGLADLVGGSVERFALYRSGGLPRGVKDGVNEVLLWLCDRTTALKKLVFSVRPSCGGAIEVGSVRLEPLRARG